MRTELYGCKGKKNDPLVSLRWPKSGLDNLASLFIYYHLRFIILNFKSCFHSNRAKKTKGPKKLYLPTVNKISRKISFSLCL